MKNTMKWLGIISTILIIGFFLGGCKGKNLNGTWVSDRYSENWIEFSGKKFSYGSYQFGSGDSWLDNRRLSDASDGTYSISDNKIEMSFSDGKIEVYPFSRTENTITIGRSQLLRK